MKKITLLLLLLASGWGYAQVASYIFSQEVGAYTEITGGTVLGTATSDDQRFVDPAVPAGGTVATGLGLPIGFDFTFNGQVYDVFAINNNGWISFGSSLLTPSVNNASTSAYLPVSSIVAFPNDNLVARVSALAKDLQAQAGSELRYETIGTAPNRMLVVQWKNYKKFGTNGTGDNFNFQIRLNETSNTVEVMYGAMVSNANAAQNFQVGLRGAPATATTNFVNRTSATDWNATTAGALATDVILMNDVILPGNGLTFTWTPPLCNAPTTAVASAITNSTATITWDIPNPAPSGYEYVVSAVNTLPTAEGTESTSPTANLTLLNANTLYYVFLRSECGSGFSNWFLAGTFVTLCNDATSFSENFDSYTTTGANVLANCWSRAGNVVSGYVTTGGATPGSPPNRLYMTASGLTPTVSYAIMPPVSNLQANSHRLKFKAYSSSAANRPLDVGYFTNAEDTESFVLIETVNLPGTAATAATFTILPIAIPAGVNRLVFRNVGIPTGTTTLYIDDVVWEQIPLCGDITGLNVTDVTANSALVYWEPGDSITAWQYVYDVATATDPSTLTPVDVIDNPFDTIAGLQPTTTYKYWVRSNCNGNFGVWAGPFTFTTLCTSVSTFPWTEGFEGIATVGATAFPPCWSKQNGDWRSSINTTSTNDSDARTGDKFITNAWTASNEYIWTPGFSLTAGVSYDFSFWYASFGVYSSWNGDVFYNTVQNSTDATLLSSFISTGNTAPSVYTKINNSFTPATDGVYYFAIRINESTGGPWYLSFDDFTFGLTPECAAPGGVAAVPTSDTTATISWNESATPPAEGYEYYVNTSNATPAADVTVTGDVGPGVLTAGVDTLTPSTIYYVWVRSACTNVLKSAWSDAFSFKTDCVQTTAFSENFDSYTATGAASPMPDCWKRAGSGATYITTGSIAPATAPNRLYLNANGATPTEAFAIMPPVSNLQADTHRLKFTAYATAADRYLEIGYFGDVSDISTYILLETIDMVTTTAATAEDYIYIPTGVPAGITSLVFRNPGTPTAATTLYIDNVIWEPVPTAVPNCVTAVTATINPDCGNFTTVINWEPATGGVDGYFLSIGTTTGGFDILNSEDIENVTSYSFVGNNDTTYYYTLVPYNSFGPASGCVEQTFTTALNGCYCVSQPTSNDGAGISNVQIGTTNFPTGDVTYFDHTATTVETLQGLNTNLQITFAAGPDYDTNVWIDFNDNYTFETSELVYQGESATANPTTLNASFVMPADAELGVHRMRIGSADFNQVTPNPCYNGTWGVTLDFHINISVPSCTPPTVTSSTVVDDCEDGQYFVAIDVSGLGSGNPVITDGTNNYPVTATGITQAGPYPTGASTTLTMLHGVDAVCDIPLGTFNFVCPPVNDDCANATVITAGGTFAASALVATNVGATASQVGTPSIPAPGCSSYMGGDVWHSVVVPPSGSITIETAANTGSSIADTGLTVYSGACETLALVECDDDDSPNGNFSLISLTGRTPGEVLYLRTFEYGNNLFGSYQIGAYDASLSSNDFQANPVLKAYPNPVKDLLNLSYTENISDVAVFNLLGQQVVTKSVNATQGQIDMSNLASGTYLVKVTANDVVKTIKVIKQ